MIVHEARCEGKEADGCDGRIIAGNVREALREEFELGEDSSKGRINVEEILFNLKAVRKDSAISNKKIVCVVFDHYAM